MEGETPRQIRRPPLYCASSARQPIYLSLGVPSSHSPAGVDAREPECPLDAELWGEQVSPVEEGTMTRSQYGFAFLVFSLASPILPFLKTWSPVSPC